MAVLDLFSTRQRRLRGEVPDVYTYDSLPQPLRVQVVHIWQEAFGGIIQEGYGVTCPVLDAFRNIHRMLAKEFGVFELTANRHDDAFTAVANYFLECRDVEQALDIVELTFKYLQVMTEGERFAPRSETSPDDAIAELNDRFKRHGIGYAYESNVQKIIRIDSQFVHSEVVKPALAILTKKRFAAASEEFAKAHTHYRERRHQECIVDCLKALESTMKVICATQKWPINATDTAKPLIKACFDHGLIPSYLESQFTSLRAVLESGVPTVRNRTSGHGQGQSYESIPGYLAAYALHLTATTIVFLADAERDLRKTNV
jgi:hypothetical protein